MGQSVEVGEDGLTDQDRDPLQMLVSTTYCFVCGKDVDSDPINFGDSCVKLRLVYPAPHTGTVMLLDALDEEGRPTAEPILFCASCWDAHTEDLNFELSQLFMKKRPGGVMNHPKSCSFCHEPIGWGDYAGHAIHGELDMSPRTHEPYFREDATESVENAEMVCMDCLLWMNDDLELNVWPHMWMPDLSEGAPDGGQEGPQGL